MATTAGQTAFDAEKSGRFLGRGIARGDRQMRWQVYAWKGEIVAAMFDANGNTGAYDVIEPDQLYMYVGDVAAAMAALAEG